jgi:hypothetical protein
MKINLFSGFLLAILFLTFTAGSLMAGSTLYDNGPYGGDIDAWTINEGFVVSDSFTLTTNATITGFAFNAWLLAGDVLTSAEVSITSNEFGGTIYFDQTVNFTQVGRCTSNSYGYNVCDEVSSFQGPSLNAGTYWVNLQNASVPNGDPVYWDENSGTGCNSPGCPSQASENANGSIPSESFTILGNRGSGTTPEGGTILLLSSALLVASGFRRRFF